MKKLAQLNGEIAERLTQSIGELLATRKHYEEEIDQIDLQVLKLKDALGESAPSARIRLKNDPQAGADTYTDSDRVSAVKFAFEQAKTPHGGNGFGRKEIVDIISKKDPHMFRNTKRGKELFSNIFWRVARELIQNGIITEKQKGGGRKPTLFVKVNN